MKKVSIVLVSFLALAVMSFKAVSTKFISNDVHISFFSHTAIEDISSNNFKVVSSIDAQTGDVVFSVPMQSFEFEKELMQKHFNSGDFLNTQTFPKSKFIGKITNLTAVNFSKDGTYNANISGDLTIKEVTKPINATGTITVAGGKISVNSKMSITLADYNISFKKGKPSTNIAKTIDITTQGNYTAQ